MKAQKMTTWYSVDIIWDRSESDATEIARVRSWVDAKWFCEQKSQGPDEAWAYRISGKGITPAIFRVVGGAGMKTAEEIDASIDGRGPDPEDFEEGL